MSNSIKLDLTADTSQAEKAILDLTKDVDKLQKKAAQTDIKGEGGGSGSRRGSYSDRRKAKSDEYNKAVKADLSPLKSAFSSISSQLGGLSSGLSNAVNTVNDFTDIVVQAAVAMKALQTVTKLKEKIDTKNSVAERVRANRARTQTILKERAQRSEMMAQRARNAPSNYLPSKTIERRRLNEAIARAHDRNAVSDRQLAADIGGNAARLRTYGPSTHRFSERGREITSRQRWNQGYLQYTRDGVIKPRRNLSSGYRYPGGKMGGISNMVRGGIGMGAGYTGRAFANVGRGVASGLATGVGAVGGGIAAGAAGLSSLGASALANPYVAGTAAVAALLGAPYLYSSTQVSKGRGKAEELTDLETQFKQLSKNISGIEIDALSKDLQRLGIEGVVPVQELSKGASMLMLAFKGNQKETAKWTNILADMSAGTGQSVDYFAELITKANQFGTVEFEVFNQLNEKGIPIIEQLKGKFGDTREEIEKAAQAGKITAEEFMKAFEAAHKVSMEGANAAKAAASRMDIQKQTEQYEELEASNLTRGYDDAQMEYDKKRRDRAKARSEDEYLIASSEALGDALGDLVQVCRMAGNGIADATQWIMEAVGAWNIEEHTTKSMDSFIKKANDATYYMNEDDATSQGVNSSILALEKDIERLRRIQSNDEFSDEIRTRAGSDIVYIQGVIESLGKKSEELAKKEEREARAAAQKREEERRQASQKAASEEYKQMQLDAANTEADILKYSGEKNLEDIQKQIGNYERMLQRGVAEESDLEEYKRLKDLEDAILKLREAIEKETQEKEEESLKAAEEARKRAEEERKLAAAREEYKLDSRVRRNEHDYAAKYELEFSRNAARMKSIGFTDAEIKKELTRDKKDAAKDARQRLKDNEAAIKQEKQNIRDSKMVGREGLENAWGSVTRTMTAFTSPYEVNSLKELKEINVNLKKEIKAISKIDTTARAQ